MEFNAPLSLDIHVGYSRRDVKGLLAKHGVGSCMYIVFNGHKRLL